MKKTLLLILITIGLMVTLLATIITDPTDGTTTVGDSMGFRLDCNNFSSANWYWGDGTSLLGVADDLSWRNHSYRNPGTYTVHMHRSSAYYPNYCNGGNPDEYRTITVLEDRSINVSTSAPSVGQVITFTAVRFNAKNITWVMGDGTTLANRTTVVSHAYSAPGQYTIRAFDWNGDTSTTPVTRKIVVAADNRVISASPQAPYAGQTVAFTAAYFNTPANITWVMGDGTTLAHAGSSVTHAYAAAGSYTVQAYDWDGDTDRPPVLLILNVRKPVRGITFSPLQPRVDQLVEIHALGFTSSSIKWNFGDGTLPQHDAATVAHRYQNPGTFMISALEENLPKISQPITILPENRSLTVSVAEARIDELVTVTAVNFRGPLVLWDFGDGSTVTAGPAAAAANRPAVFSGPATVTHAYKLPGNYTISARDENGASSKVFTETVKVMGITDQVNLEIAEITLDNGKYYKVVPKNSKAIRAQLKMKMRGTGIVSGYWIVDGQAVFFFNETAYQGQVKTIFTPEIPGLPVSDPGMHTITVQLTRPENGQVLFPTLRYFVLPYENVIAVLAPQDGAIVKEDEETVFSWERILGGSYYRIAFSNSLFSLLRNDPTVKWRECPERFSYTPDEEAWGEVLRNQWTYWKVRAVDSTGNTVAESDIQEMKVIVPGAKVGVEKITDLDGRPVPIGSGFTASRAEQLMIHGSITYPAEAEYLILRVYAGENMVDQLLFRDIRKDEARRFETSVPNRNPESVVTFQVLKSSSPSVLVGYEELKLKKD